MSYTKASQGIQFGELARAAEGLTQWRPLVMGFLSLLLAGGLGVGAGAAMVSVRGMGGVILGALIWLIAVIVVFGGASAVGVMLMDKARNVPIRSFGDAAVFGLLCIPKFLLFVILMGLAIAAFGVVAALLYLLCKIPFVGAVLAFFIHPALVLVAAFLVVAVTFVATPLFAPAVWSGLSFKDALASLVAIAQKRLIQVVLMLIVLYVIMWVVTGLLFAGLLPAASGMTSLAAAIIPKYSSLDLGSIFSGSMYALQRAFGSGAMAGAGAGLMVLMMAVGALLMQVWLMGLNLLYIQAANGVDASQASSELNSVMDDIKNRAKVAKENAVAAAERAKQAAAERAAAARAAQERAKAEHQATLAAQAEAAAAQSVAHHCPACQSSVQADDLFCGECGNKLRA
ncbi:MAG TPA: zinc ribbon domain-containing protein [Comamonas sp.]